MNGTSDPVERFLQDAENAAREGDAALALDLLVLALDTAPGDPAVLVRTHAIRDMLPDVPVPDASTAGPSVAPEAESDGPPSSAPTPDFKPPSPGSDDVLISFPDLDAESDTDDDGYFAPFDDPSDPDPALAEDSDLERISPEATDTEPYVPPKRSLALTIALYSILVAGLGAAVVATVNPAILDEAALFVERLTDPLAKGRHLLTTGRAGEALDVLQAYRSEVPPSKGPELSYLLAWGHVELGDTARALISGKAALGPDTRWETARDVARLFSRVEDRVAAADAYLFSFEQGAPWEMMEEIAQGQLDAGRLEQARHLYELMARTAPADRSAPPMPATLRDLTPGDSTSLQREGDFDADSAADVMPDA